MSDRHRSTSPVAFCRACGQPCYRSRAEAKKAARVRLHGRTDVQAFACPAGTGYYHLGRPPGPCPGGGGYGSRAEAQQNARQRKGGPRRWAVLACRDGHWHVLPQRRRRGGVPVESTPTDLSATSTVGETE